MPAESNPLAPPQRLSEEDVDRLYGLPLNEFTACRDDLVKKLRAEGRRDDAAWVKGLRKPTVAAWVVNQLVRAEPGDARALLRAADRLRSAQEGLARGDADAAELRVAAEEQRSAVSALVEGAGELRGEVTLSEATLDRIRETLRATALHEETRRRVESGRLVHEAAGVGLGLVPGAEAQPAAPEQTASDEPESGKGEKAEEQSDGEVNEESPKGAVEAEEEEPVAAVREAGPDDAAAIGRLLHAFNTEYGDPTPGPKALARRIRELMSADTAVIIGGEGSDGLAVLRFRRSIWTPGLECYLAELYVVPDRRGHGLGRALLEAAMDRARREGADLMDLNTGEDDVAARGLYESSGFTNREGKPEGPVNLYYEREL